MNPIINYLSDQYSKTRSQLMGETGISDRNIRNAISALKCEIPVFYSNSCRGYRLAKDPEELSEEEIREERNRAGICLRDLRSRKAVFTTQELVYLAYIQRCNEILDNKKVPCRDPEKLRKRTF